MYTHTSTAKHKEIMSSNIMGEKSFYINFLFTVNNFM